MTSDVKADPLRACNEAMRRGEESVSRQDLARLWGVHVNSLDRLPDSVARMKVGGKVYFAWDDLHKYLTGGKKATRRPRPDTSEAMKRLRQLGANV